MINKRAVANELIEKYKELFKLLIGRPCTLKFDKHEFPDVVPLDIKIAKTTGRKNLPDMRMDEDTGKNRTPMFFVVETNAGELLFSLDDTAVNAITNGVRMTVKLDKAIANKEEIIVDIRA